MQILQLWREVTQSLLRLPRKDSQVLLHLEPLITAGFITKRRSIVNISIESWNNTFGQEADLRYSTSLEHVLLRLHKIAELSLPSLDIRSDEEVSFPMTLRETAI